MNVLSVRQLFVVVQGSALPAVLLAIKQNVLFKASSKPTKYFRILVLNHNIRYFVLIFCFNSCFDASGFPLAARVAAQSEHLLSSPNASRIAADVRHLRHFRKQQRRNQPYASRWRIVAC